MNTNLSLFLVYTPFAFLCSYFLIKYTYLLYPQTLFWVVVPFTCLLLKQLFEPALFMLRLARIESKLKNFKNP